MRTYPPDSPQEAYLLLQRVLESIQGINECLPTDSGVQDETAGLINACTTTPVAQSVLDLQLKQAICWLFSQIQNGPTSIIINGGVDYIVEQLVFSDNIFIWECFARSFTFPTLVDCQQGLYFSTNSTDGNMSFLTRIDIPNLLAINAVLFIERIPNLTTINAGSLVHVGQDIDIASNARLTTVDFHSVEFIGRDFLASGSLLAGLQLPALTTFGGTQFLCDSNGLPTADINALLITLNSLGLTGVTINFSGGGNGPATGAGLAAAAQLVIDGNTVTLNP